MVVVDQAGDGTGETLAVRDVEELVGSVGVGSRTEETSDGKQSSGKLLTKKSHKGDRSTLSNETSGLAIKEGFTGVLERGLEPGNEGRRVPTGTRLLNGKGDLGSVGRVDLEGVLECSRCDLWVDGRGRSDRDLEGGEASQHVSCSLKGRESTNTSNGDGRSPRSVEEELLDRTLDGLCSWNELDLIKDRVSEGISGDLGLDDTGIRDLSPELRNEDLSSLLILNAAKELAHDAER